MNAWRRLYAALLRVSLLGQIQYRASGMIWMIGSILEPLVFLVVWSTVANAQGGEVGGYGPREFAAYYIVLLVVNHLTFSWTMHVFEYRVQYGELSFQLLRPIHPIHADIADNLAYKVVMMVVVTPALLLLVLGFDPIMTIVPWSLACALPALLLAFAVRFLIEWTLALAVFWTTRVLALNQLYFAILMFLSGRIAPIALLPGPLPEIARALPFYYVIAFPAELALGRLTPEAAAEGFAVQLFWLAAAAGLIASVWRVALRRFTAVGA